MEQVVRVLNAQPHDRSRTITTLFSRGYHTQVFDTLLNVETN